MIHLGRDAFEGDSEPSVICELENSCDTWQRVIGAVKTLQFESVFIPLVPWTDTGWKKEPGAGGLLFANVLSQPTCYVIRLYPQVLIT